MAPNPKPAPSSSPNLAWSQPTPARPPFPISVLGPRLGPAITAVAERTQAPTELVAHHVLTLGAMAAQRLISLRLPTGEARPVSCFFVSLVGAGEGRDAAEKLVVNSARLWVRAFEDDYPARLSAHNIEHLKTGTARPAPLKKLDLFDEFPSARADDRYAYYVAQSGFFARHPYDLVQPGALRRREASTLCTHWNGSVVRRPVAEPLHPRLSLHLVATPRQCGSLFGDRDLCESGLADRMLVAAPASRIGARMFRAAENDDPPPALDALLTYLGKLYFSKPATSHTRVVSFSKDAVVRWLKYAEEVEAALTPDGAFAPICSFAGMLPEQAARLAAIIALVADHGLTELSEAHLETGIELARFYAEERLRLLDIAPPFLTEAEQDELMGEWLRRKEPATVFTLRELCRKAPSALRNAQTLEKLMGRMERVGIVQPANDVVKAASRGPRRHAWRIENESAEREGKTVA